MLLEPRGQPLILAGLRRRRGRVDAEDFSAHLRMLERAVQVGADHSGAADAVAAAVAQAAQTARSVDAGSSVVTPRWIS